MPIRRKDHIKLVPQEILAYNIFIRLPVKSLGSCRCVSKSWNSLISDPQFIRTHLTETSKHYDTSFVFVSTDPYLGYQIYKFLYNNSNSLFPIPFEFHSRLTFDCSDAWSRIWGSCDGLVLAQDSRMNMYLLNPTTLEAKILPYLACGRRRTCVFGFGYDSSCNDYAVVAIACHQNSVKKDASVYVYMLKTNKWNEVGVSPYDHKCDNPVAGLLVSGKLHWLAKNVDDSSLLISAFDIANKKFSELPIPHKNCTRGFGLGVLKGCLCMFDNDLTAELWVMNEYSVTESWVKFSSGPYDELRSYNLVVLECGTVILLLTYAEEGIFYIVKKGFMPETHLEFGVTCVSSIVSLNGKDEKLKKKRQRRSKKM